MITKKQIFVMSIAAGVNVANIYYNQPILNNIADDLKVSHMTVGNLPTLCQAGYGLGLLLVSPLGDKIDKKKLIIILHLLLAFSLLGLAFTSNIYLLYILSLLIGLFAVSVQVIIPMAAAMSPEKKGKIVGMIFSGLLSGILIARTISGYITQWFDNWHYVFGISAFFVLLCTFAIEKTLPNMQSHFNNSYFSLIKSSVLQLKRFSLLRRNSLLIALAFGIFCSFWTTLTFKLSQAPFNYESDIIGLFGILAIAGVIFAPKIGKLAERINPFFTKFLAVLMLIISVLLIRWFDNSLLAFILATILLDIAVQAIQISNLAQIYSLDEKAHSRINTAYMSIMFLGGSIGTFVGVWAWQSGSWEYVTVQLLLWAFFALLILIYSLKYLRK
ncbi:MFS transporter [Halarcobacter anaerophilus]|uniref:MFS transporter n=1 Tax=Halarcobacter anaerophilus TaxID=877500 RepID=A0A4V1LPV4_9BACT|nr:MFS transporter [Halarcobacter anaerophilus]QDF28163.1 major facilitator superfamily transporter [Halarcobacter anaerophilus]RXJ62508.1 MFS transporter [Halarcobacter anaerophilus]